MSANSASFFRLYPDHEKFADQWFLRGPRAADGEEIDPRDFTEGLAYQGPPPATVSIRQCGKEVRFGLSAFDMPIVSKSIADTIRRVAPGAAEYFPVAIEAAHGNYEILNALERVDCLDEARSEFTLWPEEDNRTEELGRYRRIAVMRVDPGRALGHHLFRIAGWPLALLVSDLLKAAIEDAPNLGVVFDPVA